MTGLCSRGSEDNPRCADIQVCPLTEKKLKKKKNKHFSLHCTTTLGT